MARKPNTAHSYSRVPPFLRELRAQASMTQRELAAVIKKPQWWIARIETGSRRADVSEFAEFAKACGLKPDEAMRQLFNG